MASQKHAASSADHQTLQIVSSVLVDNQPCGVRLIIELAPDRQSLDSPDQTQRYHKILQTIANILATHFAAAESQADCPLKIQQHYQLANWFFASLGLHPASDGLPDLQMRPARSLIPRYRWIEAPSDRS